MAADGVQLTQLELDTARAAIAALTKLLQKADSPEKTILLSDAIRQYLDEMRHQLREKTMVQSDPLLSGSRRMPELSISLQRMWTLCKHSSTP